MRLNRIFLLILVLIYSLSSSTFAQNRSRRWKVREISFAGNETFSKGDLKGLMELEAKWPLYNDNFSRARLRSDIAAIEDYYRGQGFLNVKVVSETERDSSSRRVRIRIGITEGVRTTINAVQIEPSKIPLDTSLYKRLWSRSGRPLINQQIEEDANLLEIRYGELGYLEARADPRILVDSASHTAVVSFEVTEGPRISAGEITINGIKKLNPKVVKREIAFKEGEVLRLSRLRKSERQLYRTNLFSLVSIEPQLGVKDTAAVSGLPDTVYPVKISVSEADFFRTEIGVGYGSVEGLRGSLRISYGNLFSVGHRLAFNGNVSQRVQFAEGIYTVPWFLTLPLQFNGSVYYNRIDDEENTYFGLFRGIRLAVGRQVDFGITYQVWLDWETVDILPEENTRSTGITISSDTRNDLIDPTRGGLNLFEAQVAGLTGIKSSQFYKITNDSRIFWTAGDLGFASGLKLGYAHPYGKTDSVPTQERFFGGGPRSVRGFQEGHLRENADGSSKSGNVQVIANVIDFRFPLFWWFNGALFLDAGYVWDEGEILERNFSGMLRDLRWGAGPGIRLNTPIAVIRFDVGFKIDRLPGESSYVFHFDIGQAF